jgi:hypothetical protein
MTIEAEGDPVGRDPQTGVPDPEDLPAGTAEEQPGRERTSMDTELGPAEDPLLRREEEGAAAEAGSIGGATPDYEGDEGGPADEAGRPVLEGGEGVEEGFETSERELRETATHGENRYDPEARDFGDEESAGEGDAVAGEPDEVDPTEVVRDPREGPDDPGAGPGIAADR